MGFIQDFKDFAFKGNLIDMAVGIVMGGAVGAIVKSFLDNIITPLIAMVAGCLLYTSPSPRDRTRSRMPSSA